MQITYNAEANPSNIITFNDIPNILKVEDSSGGTYARLTLSFNSVMVASGNNQYNITFLGEAVTNTIEPANAKNRHFYIGSTTSSIAASVAMAMRNCTKVSANYTIQHASNQVILTARGIGAQWPDGITNNFSTNIPQANMSWAAIDGTAESSLNGSSIMVDVYSNGNYITTLQKIWWRGEAAFNLSPLLSTMVKPLYVTPYTVKVSGYKDGILTTLGSLGENYATVGYMTNQGMKYLDNSYLQVAQNIQRGESNPECENSSVLYVYEPSIPISFYNGNAGRMYITIDYLNSAFEIEDTEQVQWQNTDSTKKLWHQELILTERYFANAYYVDVTLGNIKVRYKSIRPFTMTEDCTRLKWVNSYGGVDFFDMTGSKTTGNTLEQSTYQKGIFDYYTTDEYGVERQYSNDVEETVTLKSHLLEKDGTYIFNDLMKSPLIWVEENNVKRVILLDSVNVEELQQNNDVFEATVKFKYSKETL